MAIYDFDNPGRGIQDCPRCKHTMTLLQQHNAIRRNEGYSLEEDSPNYSRAMYRLFGEAGWILYAFFRYVAQPFAHKRAGEQLQARHARLVARFPYTLICTHCGYILKRK